MEEIQTREFEKGSMTGVVWQCDGIRIGHAVSKFTELSSFSSSSKTDVVRMHFGMRGNYSFDYKQLNKTFDLIGGHHNMMYSHDFDMVVNNKTLELETFGIQFPKDLFIRFTAHSSESLSRFCENIGEGRSAILSDKWGTIDSPIQQVIQQIIHCKYADDLKKLFLLSKSIELLVLCADAVSASKTKKEIFIKNSTDKEKIIAVRDLINDRVHCPPNLSEIAQYVGLNEYKLKRGFKETFNNTVFGYLTDQRLNLARQYLLDTQKTAAEIASQLGYATPQHFNNAFKKKFGITPYLVRNNP
ncbi:AraC family transcriptional regulator [Dyadobacter chenwenxiniae]|uniref:AraC family transcriptional regulator n=1 Tax=Dyadobacter chenwenxiniae TaxID=2906456 RepID=A0A9X1PM96_9BACT|nr:AraC family transcriptional regulator [Dyadobacter chenwenxiniae]MCF0063020.1 AraC family transcriptional regulator [Dyadobacter chenwenxiniae]UON84807.1 AraC family transcriptional regulator [Dyadobacter chenwenxiniae]